MTSLVTCLVVISGCLIMAVSSQAANYDLGDRTLSACREDIVHLNWTLPTTNLDDCTVTLEFQALESPSVPNPKRITIMSYDNRHGWQVTDNPKRFKGRIFNTTAYSSFKLENVVKLDTGKYFLLVYNQGTYYRGEAELIVYYEDNLWPQAVGNSSDVSDDDGGVTTYTYTFSRPFTCPATGVEMYATVGDKQSKTKACSFDNATEECDIQFRIADFDGLHGTLTLEVDAIFKDGTPHCEEISRPFYNLMITIQPPVGLNTGQITGIVVVAVIAVALSCVIPPIIRYVKRKKVNHIPLMKGLTFVQECTQVIENYHDAEEDLRGIYRANKPEAQTRNFIKCYQKSNGKCMEDYTEERDLVAAAIKMFLKMESTPWLPMKLQRDVSNEVTPNPYLEDESLNIEALRRVLRETGSKEEQARYEILGHLMKHFLWLSDVRNTLDANSQVVDLDGIETVLVPNLFKEVKDENTSKLEANASVEPLQRVQSAQRENNLQKAFLGKIIRNAIEIFPENNNDDDDAVNMTHRGLLNNEENVV